MPTGKGLFHFTVTSNQTLSMSSIWTNTKKHDGFPSTVYLNNNGQDFTYRIKFIFSSHDSLVQNQWWKHQNYTSNLSKVNNKDTVLIATLEQTPHIVLLFPLLALNKQVPVDRVMVTIYHHNVITTELSNMCYRDPLKQNKSKKSHKFIKKQNNNYERKYQHAECSLMCM